jgi:hypothetical protein
LPSPQRAPRGAELGMSGGEWRSDVEQVRALAAALHT